MTKTEGLNIYELENRKVYRERGTDRLYKCIGGELYFSNNDTLSKRDWSLTRNGVLDFKGVIFDLEIAQEETEPQVIKGFTVTELVKEAYTNAKLKGFHDTDSEIEQLDGYINDELLEQIKNASTSQKLALIGSEVSEALEALRVDDWDGVKEELADIVIRVFDLAGSCGINLENEILKKMAANQVRPRRHSKKF